MSYEILETHIIFFDNGDIKQVCVLWKDNEYVRATFSDYRAKQGYKWIAPFDKLSNELLQEVAGYGQYISQQMKEKYFPGERPWSK